MTDQREKFEDEYRSRLFDRLEKRSKSFTVLFRATLIFAFAFLAFVLIPLVGLQHDEKRFKSLSEQYEHKKAQLDTKDQEVKAIQSDLDEYASLLARKQQELAAKEAEVAEINAKLENIELQIDKNASRLNLNQEKVLVFANIQSQFNALPEYRPRQSAMKLRDSLARIGSNLGSVEDLSKLPQDDKCRTEPDINAYVKCKTRETIHVGLEAYGSVIETADRELAGYVDLDGRERIDDRISQVLAVLERKLAEEPDFWHTYRGKTFFFEEFEKPMEDVFNEISFQLEQYKEALDRKKQDIFDDDEKLNEDGRRLQTLLAEKQAYRGDIAKEIEDMESDIAKLDRKYASLDSELNIAKNAVIPLKSSLDDLKQIVDKIPQARANIEKRLDNVQTPFGTLPVGLNEALLVFPVLIAAGLLICCFMLIELMRLRREYHLGTRKQFPDNTEEIDSGITLVAPIWLDPCGEKSTTGWRLVLLSLPALAYVVALALIIYSWALGGTQPGSATIIRSGYLVLYLLGIAGLVIAARRLYLEWRGYHKALAAAAP